MIKPNSIEMSFKLTVIIFSSAAVFVISYSYYKSSTGRELNEAKFYFTKRQENIYRQNRVRFAKMCALFQTAKPSILMVLFVVIIASKFQDYKENIPTSKDKMSILGTQYFKLKIFKYEEIF